MSKVSLRLAPVAVPEVAFFRSAGLAACAGESHATVKKQQNG
jgi:hypothetical protein